MPKKSENLNGESSWGTAARGGAAPREPRDALLPPLHVLVWLGEPGEEPGEFPALLSHGDSGAKQSSRTKTRRGRCDAPRAAPLKGHIPAPLRCVQGQTPPVSPTAPGSATSTLLKPS